MKIKKIFVAALFIITSLAFFPLNDYAFDYEGEELKLYMGQPKIIPVNHPLRVMVGNPEIADIVNVTRTEITLSPKSAGSTTLVFWDNLGEQSFKIRVFGENMHYIKERVDNILSKLDLPEVYSQAEDSEGKVLLLGNVANSAEREKLNQALLTVKEKTVDLVAVKDSDSMVEIDVQVVEFDKDASSELGFSWPGSVSLADVSSPIATATGFRNVWHVSDFTRSAFSVTFNALVQEGKARILSRPRLACQSGKEAELLVGGEKPIFTTVIAPTTGASGSQVEYKQFGIKLNVKPTVTKDDRVKLVLNVEVSEVGTADTIGTSTTTATSSSSTVTAKAFPLTKRTTSTELYLNDGQTMAISGLIKEKEEEDIRKTPWLGDLPLIGGVFRKKSTRIGGGQGERGNTELFVMLTPTIISGKKTGTTQDKVTVKPAVPAVAAALSAPQTIAESEDVPEPLKDYTRIIQKRILENLTYPPSAKESGFQGTVKLSLHLLYSGELVDVVVKSPSGYNILDDNVLSIARNIAHYPPFPPAIEKEELWIDIPIDYRLN